MSLFVLLSFFKTLRALLHAYPVGAGELKAHELVPRHSFYESDFAATLAFDLYFAIHQNSLEEKLIAFLAPVFVVGG